MKTIIKLSLIPLILFIVYTIAYSQKINIETDPIAYALKWFSVHAGLNTDYVRYDIGLYEIEI